VICGRPRLSLAIAYGGRGVNHIRAARLLVVAAIVVDRGCSLQMVLFVPLLAALGALLGILNDDVGRCFPIAAWGLVKLGHLVVDGLLGSDTAVGVHKVSISCTNMSSKCIK
jgi:hypothetical protein